MRKDIKPSNCLGFPMFQYSRSLASAFSSLRSLFNTMPGLELFSKRSEPQPTQSDASSSTSTAHVEPKDSLISEVYSNPRLDPSNYLDGPLSWNPATRLRQMLARPGIVVAPGICDGISARCALEAGFDCLYQRCVCPRGLI